MHEGEYILHARRSGMEKVPAEKIRLPLDPCGHIQRLSFFRGPDGAIYAGQCSVLSKSTDGGQTWTHTTRETSGNTVPDNHFMDVRILANGKWIRGRDCALSRPVEAFGGAPAVVQGEPGDCSEL